MFVPCGHCIACRDSYTRKWRNRLDVETKNSVTCLFFTLTYDNDHIPSVLHDGSNFHSQCGNRVESFNIDDKIYNDEKIEKNVPYILDHTKRRNFEISVNSKRDLQLFLKRLRRHISYDKQNLLQDVSSDDRKIRYFLCTEYGPTTYRTHAHGLLWFRDRRVSDAVLKQYFWDSWKFGARERQSIEYVISNAPSYVSKYVTTDARLPYILRTDYTKTFKLFSRRPSIGICDDSLSVLSRIIEKRDITYIKTYSNKSDGVVDRELTYENRFLRYWFPNLLFSSRLSPYFLRKSINYATQLLRQKGVVGNYVDDETLSFVLPNVIKAVQSKYHLLDDNMNYDINGNPDRKVYSDVADIMSNYEYMFGQPQSRLFIKRALLYIHNTKCTIDDYVDNYYLVRTLAFTHSYKNLVECSNYMYQNPNALMRFLLTYPSFALNLPQCLDQLDSNLEILYNNFLYDYDHSLSLNDFYDHFLIKKVMKYDQLSTYHTSTSEFILVHDKIKDSNNRFAKRRKINYLLHSND